MLTNLSEKYVKCKKKCKIIFIQTACMVLEIDVWSKLKYWMNSLYCTDNYGLQRMNPADLADPLSFLLLPPAGLHF